MCMIVWNKYIFSISNQHGHHSLRETQRGEKLSRQNRLIPYQYIHRHAESPYTKENDQLTLATIQELLSLPNMEGVCSNGRVNVERLCEKVATSEGTNSAKELQRLLNKKEMKVGELHQLLKSFELA